jgi:hypothetical protein
MFYDKAVFTLQSVFVKLPLTAGFKSLFALDTLGREH